MKTIIRLMHASKHTLTMFIYPCSLNNPSYFIYALLILAIMFIIFILVSCICFTYFFSGLVHILSPKKTSPKSSLRLVLNQVLDGALL